MFTDSGPDCAQVKTTVIDSISQKIAILKPPVPVYVPTPKYLLEACQINGSSETERIKKKPKLEYVPKSKNPIQSSYERLTYIPSAIKNSATTENNLILEFNSSFDIDDISGMTNELYSESTQSETKAGEHDNHTIIKENSKDLNSCKDKDKSSSSSSRHHRHSNGSKSYSSRSSDRHKDGHKSSSRSSKKSSKSSHRTHSSSSNKSKSDYSNKSRKIEKSKKADERLSSGTKSPDDKLKERKSSSTKQQRISLSQDTGRESSNSSKTKHIDSTKTKMDDSYHLNELLNEMSSEEDDVEAQCRMIFDEFDTSTVAGNESSLRPTLTKDESGDPLSKYNDVAKKKRVAYENADNHSKPLDASIKNLNHVQSAMQVILRNVVKHKISDFILIFQLFVFIPLVHI